MNVKKLRVLFIGRVYIRRSLCEFWGRGMSTSRAITDFAGSLTSAPLHGTLNAYITCLPYCVPFIPETRHQSQPIPFVMSLCFQAELELKSTPLRPSPRPNTLYPTRFVASDSVEHMYRIKSRLPPLPPTTLSMQVSLTGLFLDSSHTGRP